MPIEVTVITDGSDLGEELLRDVWRAAQEIFREYKLEVFVRPYYNPVGGVTLIIGGLEFSVTRRMSIKEITDLILSASVGGSESEFSIMLGLTVGNDNTFSDGCVIA